MLKIIRVIIIPSYFPNTYVLVVYNQNQVSLSGTKTKVQFQYRWIIWKYSKFGSKFGFKGPFMMEKNTPYYR